MSNRILISPIWIWNFYHLTLLDNFLHVPICLFIQDSRNHFLCIIFMIMYSAEIIWTSTTFTPLTQRHHSSCPDCIFSQSLQVSVDIYPLIFPGRFWLGFIAILVTIYQAILATIRIIYFLPTRRKDIFSCALIETCNIMTNISLSFFCFVSCNVNVFFLMYDVCFFIYRTFLKKKGDENRLIKRRKTYKLINKSFR